jgi:lipopolysaccharide/colanic/teichoic acid biosynthesis glycosyltransferase
MYKRAFDLVVLLLAHLLLFPVFLLLWTVIPTLIWLSDRGPILYRQQRGGRHGQIFTILKFRTMVNHADQLGPPWTLEDWIQRVTRVGRFLRRTALDELPQTINMLRGEMSLVGPRPYPLKQQRLLEELPPGFSARQLGQGQR